MHRCVAQSVVKDSGTVVQTPRVTEQEINISMSERLSIMEEGMGPALGESWGPQNTEQGLLDPSDFALLYIDTRPFLLASCWTIFITTHIPAST